MKARRRQDREVDVDDEVVLESAVSCLARYTGIEIGCWNGEELYANPWIAVWQDGQSASVETTLPSLDTARAGERCRRRGRRSTEARRRG